MNVFQAPATTMTTEEAEAIVRRHLERVPPTPDGPSIAEVAEALKVRPEEIASLLAEVRAETRLQAPRRKVARRERRVWLLSGVAAVLLGATGLAMMRGARVGPFRTYGAPSTMAQVYGKPYLVVLDGQQLSMLFLSNHDVKSAEQVLPKKTSQVLSENALQLGHRAFESDQVVDEARRAVAAGRWGDAPGVRIASLEIRKGDFGNAMRWARATVPVYQGDDALVADAVAVETERRLAAAVKVAMKGLPTPPNR